MHLKAYKTVENTFLTRIHETLLIVYSLRMNLKFLISQPMNTIPWVGLIIIYRRFEKISDVRKNKQSRL